MSLWKTYLRSSMKLGTYNIVSPKGLLTVFLVLRDSFKKKRLLKKFCPKKSYLTP